MKKWILTGLVLIVLIGLALSAHRWLSPFFGFAGANANVIQSVTGLVQVVLGIAACIAAFTGLRSSSKANSRNVNISGNAQNNKIITGDNNTINEAASPIVTSLHQLQPPSGDFTNRVNELLELSERLESGVRIYVLQGMGGIGKSDLARKFADQHLLARYGDAQFYLDLKGTMQPSLAVADALRHVIGSYHPTAELPNMEPKLSVMYRSVLFGKRVVLFFDNAASKEQVEPLIPPPSCIMVITSRQSIVLPGMHTMTLTSLPPEEARTLLLKIAPRIGDQADTIARLCGCLPLALRLAASAIAESPNLTAKEYARILDNKKQRLELIEASFDLSYELLNEEQRIHLRSLALFPDTFEVSAASAILDLGPNQARSALGDLLKFSFVEWQETTTRYRLHDLVRVFADARLEDAERSANNVKYVLYYLDLLRNAGNLYWHSDQESMVGLNLFNLEWTNIQASQEWVINHINEDKAAAIACDYYTYAGAYLLALKRPPDERIRWHEAVVAAAQRLQLRSVEGGNLTFIGIAYRDLGMFDRTIEYCEQALTIVRQEGDSQGESNALSYAGIAYFYKGNYAKAIDQCRQALAITRRIKDKRTEVEQLRYLGHARRGLGQFEQAVENYELSRSVANQIKDLNGENNALGGLGRIYCDMGKHEEARTKFLLDALKIARELGDRRGEGYNLAHLGLAHRDLGLYAEAIDYYEQALKVVNEIGNHSIEAYCQGGMGKTHLALGDLPTALKYIQAAVKTSSDIKMKRGQQHWETLLAQIYLYGGQIDAALETVGKAFSYDSEWNNYRTFALHGLVLAKLNQVQPASEAFTQAVAHAERLLAKTPSYFDARYILGMATCGQAVTTTEERAALIAQVNVAYRNAYRNCPSRGVIEEALRLLNELLKFDGTGELSEPRELLRQFATAQTSPT